MAKKKQKGTLNSSSVANIGRRTMPFIQSNPDLGLALGVILILGLLIIPLPPVLLDMFLAVNITISVLILLISVYLKTPLEFSSFPSVLLITTLFRLGLNVASTRLILGKAEAGEIIHAFGNFVIEGNYVVGIIIFLILLIINFIVVIKGSSRIAEVGARFALDALPGKQMSIDADLNAGYIDEQTAKQRRKELTRESDFYGAMDGAAKFIKGDAIAGIIITIINLMGGFLIGIFQYDMSFETSITTYSILTIGDGLVSQIPSLLISVAGGLVVTRSGADDNLDVEIAQQFGSKPKPLYVAAVTLALMSMLPGFPVIPFLVLATALAAIGYFRQKTIKADAEAEARGKLAEAEESKEPSEQPVESLLRVDPIEIELGYSLIQLVDETQGGDVFKRITNVRRQLAQELGIIVPPVRVRDNLQLDPETYIVKIRGNEIATNQLQPNRLLAMNPGTAEGELQGINVTEPVFGLPATWVQAHDRENAEIMGYTVVEPPTVLTTHLTELLRRNSDKLLTRQDVKHLMENLRDDYPALIEEATPELLPMSIVQKVLQNLLIEGVPIRDLAMILESLLEYINVTKNVDVLTEYVRHNLSETIKKLYENENGVIHAIAVDPRLEDQMSSNLQTAGDTTAIAPSLGLSPSDMKLINASLEEAINEVTLSGHLPVVICSAQIRPFFYRMIHTKFPMVSVISYTELPPDTDVELQASVELRLPEKADTSAE
jgi:flagellar biosynthesis protein FlhA